MIDYVRCSIDRLTILVRNEHPLALVAKVKELLGNQLANRPEVEIVDYAGEMAFGVVYSEYDRFDELVLRENLVYINAVDIGETSDMRVDFNPNALIKHDVEYVWNTLRYIFKLLRLELRLSRFDLAFDIINAPEIQKMQNIKGGVTRKMFYGRSGALETVYWGSQSSTVQVRLYDKKTELGGILGDLEYAGIETDARGFYKIQIKDLWRLEMQMRTKAIDENLADEVVRRLDDFSMVSVHSLKLDDEIKPFAYIFMTEPSDIPLFYKDVNERTMRRWKAKVRKAVREANDEYVIEIKKALQRDSGKLAEELKRYCDIYLGF